MTKSKEKSLGSSGIKIETQLRSCYGLETTVNKEEDKMLVRANHT